ACPWPWRGGSPPPATLAATNKYLAASHKSGLGARRLNDADGDAGAERLKVRSPGWSYICKWTFANDQEIMRNAARNGSATNASGCTTGPVVASGRSTSPSSTSPSSTTGY